MRNSQYRDKNRGQKHDNLSYFCPLFLDRFRFTSLFGDFGGVVG